MWIAIGGLAVPLLVLSVLFVLGLNLLMDFPIHGYHGHSGDEMRSMMKPEIRIVGHQWWWEIQYLNDDPSQGFTTANELHLPVGRPVDVEVVTRDVMHSFWIPALHGKVDLIPRPCEITSGWRRRSRATSSGSAQSSAVPSMHACACWPWRKALTTTTRGWKGSASRRPPRLRVGRLPGRACFWRGHAQTATPVRGTVAGGRVAPDLTHLGSPPVHREQLVSQQQRVSRSLGNACAVAQARRTNAEPHAIQRRAVAATGRLPAATEMKESTMFKSPRTLATTLRTMSLSAGWDSRIFPAAVLLAMVAVPALAQSKPECAGLPDAARLKSVVKGVVSEGSSKNGGHWQPGMGGGHEPATASCAPSSSAERRVLTSGQEAA